jgi:hypothetical protein
MHNSDNQCVMIRHAILILILFSLISGSCSSRHKKLDRRNLIPEKEFVSILTDVYITDGLISQPKIQSWFSSLDTLKSYYHIIEKHGYSKENMDKTIKYYFIKNPKELIKIYDQVLGILSEKESLVEKEALLAQGHKENLWPCKDYYSFPDPHGIDSSSFDMALNKAGTYTLSFSTILFPDDQSVNPKMSAYLCHPDSIETGKRNYIPSIRYFKDGQPHFYSFYIKVPENTSFHLRGSLFYFDNLPGEWGKNVRFFNLSVYFVKAFV